MIRCSFDSSSKLQVLKQIQELEDNIERLDRAIGDKENPLKLSETRLDNRSQRPNVELCRDSVQYKLVEEVQEIQSSVGQLKDRLADSEGSLKGLIRRQLDLEEDISVKANSLFIDETECMGMRKSINLQTY